MLYGSDAIGGTVNALIKGANAYGADRNFGGNLSYSYASAEDSHSVRAEASASLDASMSIHMGVGGKCFGDLQGGRDIGEQPGTGYDEWAADVKLEKFLDSDTRLVFAYQEVRQDDVPRTHSTVNAVPEEYLDRQMPLSAQLGARWEDPLGSSCLESVAVFADNADKLSARDAADTSRIPAGFDACRGFRRVDDFLE